MKNSFPKPRILISKCLGFAPCRWNGGIIKEDFIERLKSFVDSIVVCPECEIGLGVPRDPLRIILKNRKHHLIQLNTGKDITVDMETFVEKYLSSLKDIDGFLLKERSPSCGIKDVKIYNNPEASSHIKKDAGFFGRRILEIFLGQPIETEVRLNNLKIREYFLVRIFVFAKFRIAYKSLEIKELIKFHTENKFLFMLYNQKELKFLGNIVANREKKKVSRVFKDYQEHLYKVFFRLPRRGASINVLMHIFGYFKNYLKPKEKTFFFNTLEEYREDQISLSGPISLLRSYAIRYEQPYIDKQSIFEPFPKELSKERR